MASWRPAAGPNQPPPQQAYGSYTQPQAAQQYQSQQPPQQYQSQQLPPHEYQQIQQWFQAVDTDRSGQINVQELHRCLSMGGNNFDINVVSRLILAFDTDRSGEIGIC